MVNLQRRHFQFIADTLASLKGNIDDAAHVQLVEHFCDKLASTNYQFKRQRFYDRSRCVTSVPYHVRKARKKSLAAHVWAAELKIEEAKDGDHGYWE